MSLPYPDIDPVALQLGPVAIRWYGLAYVAGLMLGWRYAVGLVRQKRFNPPGARPTPNDLGDFITWAIIGVLVGGRLGIVVFYHLKSYLADPLQILRIWEGGMSFHGGLLGITAATVLFARKRQIPLARLSDMVACAGPIGLFFGRIANFINGELWGRIADVEWAMVFPNPYAGPYPRHPSQLYEAASEGLILFALLAIAAQQPAIRNRPGLLTGLFMIGYAIARSVCELYREPDYDVGFIFGPISMGQVLSLPMVLLGGAFIWYALKRPAHAAA